MAFHDAVNHFFKQSEVRDLYPYGTLMKANRGERSSLWDSVAWRKSQLPADEGIQILI